MLLSEMKFLYKNKKDFEDFIRKAYDFLKKNKKNSPYKL